MPIDFFGILMALITAWMVESARGDIFELIRRIRVLAAKFPGFHLLLEQDSNDVNEFEHVGQLGDEERLNGIGRKDVKQDGNWSSSMSSSTPKSSGEA